MKHPISTTPTMTSLELVDIINAIRPEGSAELRHDNFMKKIESHPGIQSPKFLGDYKDSRGRMQKCYHLPKRECELLVMSESLEVQTRVYDRMTELEHAMIQSPQKASAIAPTKEFRALFGIARLIGLDKNAAALSANQAVAKLTGTNVMQLLGHTHLDANNQESMFFTPTELGERIGVSGRKFNMLLAEAGLQAKKGEHWLPLTAAEGFCRILDTGKRHGDGSMIQQIKWADNVLSLIQQAA